MSWLIFHILKCFGISKTRAKMTLTQQNTLLVSFDKLWRPIYYLFMFSRQNLQLPLSLGFPKTFIKTFYSNLGSNTKIILILLPSKTPFQNTPSYLKIGLMVTLEVVR